MAKSSVAMETIQVSAQNEALSEGQARRQNSVRNNEYAQGLYLFIPMRHFCTDVVYNGEKMKSKRVVCFKLDENGKIEYPRTFKVSYFTETLSALREDGAPKGIKTEMQEDGLRHIVAGQLSAPIRSTESRIPKSVTKDNYLHIDAPFVINYKGIRGGYMPQFEQTPKGYQVKTDESGNVLFQAANITNFEVVEHDITDALINEAKTVLKNDSQLSGVKVD
jgi:hypothetical protein